MNQAERPIVDCISRLCERFDVCGLRGLAKLCSNGMSEGLKRVWRVENRGESFDFKLKASMTGSGLANRSTFELITSPVLSTQKA